MGIGVLFVDAHDDVFRHRSRCEPVGNQFLPTGVARSGSCCSSAPFSASRELRLGVGRGLLLAVVPLPAAASSEPCAHAIDTANVRSAVNRITVSRFIASSINFLCARRPFTTGRRLYIDIDRAPLIPPPPAESPQRSPRSSSLSTGGAELISPGPRHLHQRRQGIGLHKRLEDSSGTRERG